MKIIKTVDQLKEQAKKINLHKWTMRHCSMCGYPLAYLINEDQVEFDCGCNCVSWNNVEMRSWEEIEETFNRNLPENNPNIKQSFLDELNVVWQFPEKFTALPQE